MDIAELTEQIVILQAQVVALNAHIERMDAHRLPAPKSWLRRRIRPAVWQVAFLGAFFATAVAQTAKDPISVGPDGKVRIGTSLEATESIAAKSFTGDGASLTVGTGTLSNALSNKIEIGKQGSIEARHSDIYFTDTNHDHTGWGNALNNAAIENAKDYHSLMILGRREVVGTKDSRLVRVWDTLGVGGAPDAKFEGQIDVKGEIRGKIWRSSIYTWKQGNLAVQMSRADRAACFLTAIGGKFAGGGEEVKISENNKGYWSLSGISAQHDVHAEAICIGAPDSSW